MKRFKNLVIGGIQSKVFNLILVTVLLLTAAFLAVSAYHSRLLAKLVAESGENQQAAVSEITGQVMDQVVAQSLGRNNNTEARFADDMFRTAGERVTFLAEQTRALLTHPQDYGPRPYAAPDPSDDGTWTAKAVYAGGVDADDPAVADKLGLLANLSDEMIDLCRAFGVEDVYIALPEGALFTADNISSSWYVDGKPLDYDPREREWYRKAVQADGLIFTDGEWDANTGAYCVECAMPVRGADGELLSVVGLDLFLDEIQSVMRDSSVDGEYSLLVNQDGRAVLPMQAEVFPMAEADRARDLRQSESELLSQAVGDALAGKDASVSLGRLDGADYYVVATPIPTTGWVLVSAFDQALADRPATLLSETLSTIQSEAAQTYRTRMAKAQTQTMLLFIAVMLLTLGGALALGKRIVRPLNAITRRVSRLSEGNLEFSMEDAYRTGDEVEELARSFATLSHKTVEYMDRIVKVTAEKERLGTELSLATQIQASMLPHIFPAFPERGEFDVFASMNPAKEVGGDFYDYFLIDDDHLGIVMADVSGKGVPAALFMMACKILLQTVAMMGSSPAQVLTRVNEAICSENEAQMFVTVWMGILQLSSGRLIAANAGHEFPVLKAPNGAFELYRDRHGFVLGGMDGVRYREYEVRLEPGAKLFLYTDGVPEATNGEKELFGVGRMVEALNEAPDAPPMQILHNVRRAVDGFVKDAEQFDDLTMLCVEYKGRNAIGGERA